jgi:hypothetical protein
LLDVGDHRGLAAAGPQRRHEIARGRQVGHLTLELIKRHPLTGNRHLPILLPHDLLEDVLGLLFGMGNPVFEVGHLDGGIGGAAADLQDRRASL